MTTEPDPDRIRQFGYAVAPPCAVLAGMQLDVFTPLRDGPLDAEALAKLLGVPARRLRPVLYALVGAELLSVEEERFANTPLAERFLVRGQPTYMGGVHELWSDVWQALLKTADSAAPVCRRPSTISRQCRATSSPLSSVASILSRWLPDVR